MKTQKLSVLLATTLFLNLLLPPVSYSASVEVRDNDSEIEPRFLPILAALLVPILGVAIGVTAIINPHATSRTGLGPPIFCKIGNSRIDFCLLNFQHNICPLKGGCCCDEIEIPPWIDISDIQIRYDFLNGTRTADTRGGYKYRVIGLYKHLGDDADRCLTINRGRTTDGFALLDWFCDTDSYNENFWFGST